MIGIIFVRQKPAGAFPVTVEIVQRFLCKLGRADIFEMDEKLTGQGEPQDVFAATDRIKLSAFD